MINKIKFCRACKEYTMKETCNCGTKTINRIPPKFSPEDKFGKYRRQMKKESFKKEGLI